jgi:uncharacterized protein YraI
MRRIIVIPMITVVGLLLMAPTSAVSQTPSPGETCPELVRTAYATTADLCDATGRNQACYGHSLLQATAQPDVTSFKFSQEGDLADVSEIQSLRLSVMDDTTGAWGISLMRLQANMPNSQLGKNVTLLLMGDVEISADQAATATQEATVSARGNVNVRQSPTLSAEVIDILPPGRYVTADGRLADSSWIRVRLPNNGGTGWIARSLLASTSGFEDLDAVDTSSQYYTPMQAFTFRSGTNDALCAEAPDSGIVIKTPEGMGKITLLINEVNVQVGSTVFFQAQPGADMAIRVIEGDVRVSTFDMAYNVTTGNETTVPVDNDLHPTGPPTPPKPYDPESVRALPLALLDQLVPPVPPAVKPDKNQKDALGLDGDGLGPSDGTDAYSSGDHKVTICHMAGDNKKVTITVDMSALDAHLAHGDSIGACDESATNPASDSNNNNNNHGRSQDHPTPPPKKK